MSQSFCGACYCKADVVHGHILCVDFDFCCKSIESWEREACWYHDRPLVTTLVPRSRNSARLLHKSRGKYEKKPYRADKYLDLEVEVRIESFPAVVLDWNTVRFTVSATCSNNDGCSREPQWVLAVTYCPDMICRRALQDSVWIHSLQKILARLQGSAALGTPRSSRLWGHRLSQRGSLSSCL